MLLSHGKPPHVKARDLFNHIPSIPNLLCFLYFCICTIITACWKQKYNNIPENQRSRKDDHCKKYRQPTEGDSRSPCPALNTLANHGYINRSGRHLNGPILVRGLREAYALSTPLACVLAYGGLAILGQFDDVSLHDISRHNRIEHDASIAHEDVKRVVVDDNDWDGNPDGPPATGSNAPAIALRKPTLAVETTLEHMFKQPYSPSHLAFSPILSDSEAESSLPSSSGPSTPATDVDQTPLGPGPALSRHNVRMELKQTLENHLLSCPVHVQTYQHRLPPYFLPRPCTDQSSSSGLEASSLVESALRVECKEYPLHSVCPHLFEKFVDDARAHDTTVGISKEQDGPLFTATSIAHTRARRERESKELHGPECIDAVHQEIARGETALVLSIFGVLSGQSEKYNGESSSPSLLGQLLQLFVVACWTPKNATDPLPNIPDGSILTDLKQRLQPWWYRTSLENQPKPRPIVIPSVPLSRIESFWRYEQLPHTDGRHWKPERATTLIGTMINSLVIKKYMAAIQATKGSSSSP